MIVSLPPRFYYFLAPISESQGIVPGQMHVNRNEMKPVKAWFVKNCRTLAPFLAPLRLRHPLD